MTFWINILNISEEICRRQTVQSTRSSETPLVLKATPTELEVLKSAPVNAGTFTPHIIDKGALERARVKCREVVASEPDRYSHIIESAPLRAG